MVLVIVSNDFEIDTFVTVYHIYTDRWTLEIGESLNVQTETNKPVDKCTVFIWKSGKVVGHLKKGATGTFVKTIFFSLKDDPYSKAKTITSGCRCNLGDVEDLKTKACWSTEVYRLSPR